MNPILEMPYEVVEKREINRHLTDLLKEASKRKNDYKLKEYFNLSELINPANAYHERTREEGVQIFNSEETEKRLNLGKKIERETSFWLKEMEGFESEQDKLDGAFVGVPGVVGRIDFLIKDSVIELKSKKEMPENEEEIFRKYPQDVEQLAFYSVLRSSKIEKNYLVFITQSEPYEIKAYRLLTKDFGKVKSILINRRDRLKKALEDKDPSMLGRCRYFRNGCKFEDNKVCSCELMNPVSESVFGAVELSYDPEFTETLRTRQEESSKNRFYYVSHLISPRAQLDVSHRKAYVESGERKASLHAFETSVRRMIKDNGHQLSPEEREKLKIIDSRLNLSRSRWIRLPSSSSSEQEILPYLVKVTNANPDYGPNNFHIRQLALTCAAFNVKKGLIFVSYAETKIVKSFEIVFRSSLSRIENQIRELLDEIDGASESGDYSALPKCPGFFGCCNE